MTDIALSLTPTETDTLLATVKEQVAQQTFDPNNQQLLKQMVECLGDTRGMVRLAFAELIGVIGKPATPFLLEALANHPNPVVRRASGKTLTLIQDPASVPTLINSLLYDEDTVVKGSCVGALARIGEVAVPALLAILTAPEHSESIKGHVSWALAFMGTETKEYIYQAWDSDSAEIRCAVIGAIAKIAEETEEDQAFNILIQALNDPASMVRTESAAVMGNLRYQPAIPYLIELLNHEYTETRRASALSLMKIGSHDALKALEIALNKETDANVASAIKLAITQIEKQSEEDENFR